MSRFLKACAVAAISVEGVKLQPGSPTVEQIEQALMQAAPSENVKCSDMKTEEDGLARLQAACGPDVKPETLTGEVTPAKYKAFVKRLVPELKKNPDPESALEKKVVEYTQEVCCPKTCC